MSKRFVLKRVIAGKVHVMCDEAVEFATQQLKAGHIVAVPTDTVYGLAVNAKHCDAVESLYDIKGRDKTKPLAICVAEVEDIHLWAHFAGPKQLLKNLLPGPVTVVLERRSSLLATLNPGFKNIGIRVPDHPVVRTLSSKLGGPLALTSANLSGKQSPVCVSEFQELLPYVKAVIDEGNLALGKPSDLARCGSTVVDLTIPGKVQHSSCRNGIISYYKSDEIVWVCEN